MKLLDLLDRCRYAQQLIIKDYMGRELRKGSMSFVEKSCPEIINAEVSKIYFDNLGTETYLIVEINLD